jgi:hypothetical protein
VICGFSVIDDETRMIIIEGLGGIGLGMQEVYADIPRKRENDQNLTILCNPEVLFPHRSRPPSRSFITSDCRLLVRLYTSFGPDLKRVRPRERLKKLAKRPEIYNRKQVDLECFEAIDKLMNLRTCPDIKTTKELDCYPSPEAIQKLELLYGDALSKEDLDGTTQILSSSIASLSSETERDSRGIERSFLSSTSMDDMQTGGNSVSHHSRSRRLQPTDSHNVAFDEMIRARDPSVPRIDRLQEQRVSPSLSSLLSLFSHIVCPSIRIFERLHGLKR